MCKEPIEIEVILLSANQAHIWRPTRAGKLTKLQIVPIYVSKVFCASAWQSRSLAPPKKQHPQATLQRNVQIFWDVSNRSRPTKKPLGAMS